MKRSRLFRKTLLFMILSLGGVAVVMSLVFAHLVNRNLTAEYTDKAEALARTIAESDLALILDRDAAGVQSRIDQYLHIRGVAYVLVADEQGDILAHTFVPAVPPEVLARVRASAGPKDPDRQALTELHTAGGQDYLHVATPMLEGLAGTIHIGMDRGEIRGYIHQALVQQLSITLLLFALCTIVAALFMRNISQPLVQLTEYAGKVAAHDFSAEVDISSKDEVGDLARSMRSMARDVSGMVTGLEAAVANATGDLKEALSSLSAVLNNMAEGLLVIDAEGRVVRHNPALARLFRLEGATILGRLVGDLLGPETAKLIRPDAPEDRDATGAPRALETLAQRADGTFFPVEVSSAPVALKDQTGTVSILRDVTERKRHEEALRQAHDDLEQKVEERTRELSRANIQLKIEVAERKVVAEALRKAESKYRSIFENAGEGIYQVSPDGHYISANPALARILGYADVESLLTELRDSAGSRYVEPGKWRELLALILDKGEVKGFESQFRRRSGRVIWISENARMVRDSRGNPLYVEGSVEDITLRKEYEAQLLHQAFHDPLTLLPNRALFLDHLRMAMERRKRQDRFRFAVLYLDLDRFKVINDSLGHAAGDELLRSVAQTLARCARSMDTVARFGGDEFAVLLEDITAPRDAIRIARRILEDMGRPFDLRGHEVFTSASIGIVLHTESYEHPDALLRDADTAMYRAKEQGKSRFKVFNHRMHVAALRLMELETDLRRAVDSRDLRLVYQPIVRLDDRRVVAFEALLRWTHPVHGPVRPDEFIPLAEDAGLIYPIDYGVLHQVCQDLSSWMNGRGPGPSTSALTVHVNVSGKHFRNPFLVGEVEAALLDSGLPPACLTLEITESAFVDNLSTAADVLAKLKSLGVNLCIDDFGTGYSSLGYLQRYPIDVIKVDKSFVAAVNSDADTRAIATSIISLGNSLGLSVVAEGVETPEQLEFLRQSGCGLAQGFLFHKPVGGEEALDLLHAQAGRPKA
ncbi:EAL domain-containing protein [Desulfovibrio aminophilus]|nr:EAL domain-containing protein [Desulfovibrio aminophilus]MCM0754741.1 EAL domain-containing protein [Desulfovibrio aminophilus]